MPANLNVCPCALVIVIAKPVLRDARWGEAVEEFNWVPCAVLVVKHCIDSFE